MATIGPQETSSGGDMRRPLRVARRFGAVLAAAALAASAGLMSAPMALAGTCPGPCLGLSFGDDASAVRPAGVDVTQGSEVLQGLRSWGLAIHNDQYDTVAATHALINVQSGYPASTLEGPLSVSTAALGPVVLGLDVNSTIPVTFIPGFDSTRAMSPEVIPAGGGSQLVQVTFTRTAASACQTNIPSEEGCGFEVVLGLDGLAGASIAAVTGPSNLDQGETFTSNLQPSSANWNMGDPILGKTYAMTATINLPDLGYAYAYKPSVMLTLGDSGPTGCHSTSANSLDTCAGPTMSVTLPDASLDGATPGAGKVTFSVDQSVIWDIGGPRPDTSVLYAGLNVAAKTDVAILSDSAVGRTQAGFTASTKVVKAGAWVTIRFQTRPALAGKILSIWLARKVNGMWTKPSPHSSVKTNAQGVAYYSYRAGSEYWSFVGRYAGDATTGPASSSGTQARWL